MANSAVVGLLRALLVADTAEFDKAMKRAGDSAKEWSRDLKQVGAQATAVGRTLTTSLTLPLAGLAAGAAKLAIDFESSFAGVRKTVDATEPELQKLSEQFRALSKEIPISVNEINKLAETAGALGIPKESIAEFVKVMAGLGVATNLTAEQAANSIARIQTIFGAAGKQTEQFASTLVALGNAGASTESEIVEMAQRIAGAGHSVGLTQAQVLALSSSLAGLGIEAELGGSAMSRVLLKMNQAVLSGGDDLKKWADLAKVSTTKFREAFEQDAAGALTMIVEKLGTMGKAAGPAIQELIGKNIGLTQVMLSLAGASKNLTETLALGSKAWEENTALTAETSKRYATMESQLVLLWNRIKDVGLSLGEALMPALKLITELFGKAVPYLEAAVKAFTALPAPVQAAALGFAAILAAAGPALMLFGSMSTGLGTLVGAFKTGGIAAEAFGGILAFIAANPITVAIAALGLLGIGIYAVVTAETELEKELRENSSAFREHTTSLESALTTYDALKSKQNLTTEETKKLDAAIRTLAEASGLSVEAFKKQQAGSDFLTGALRAQLQARKELAAEAIKQAKAQMDEASALIREAEDRREHVLGLSTLSDTQKLEALKTFAKEIAQYEARLAAARQALQDLTGVERKDISLKAEGTAATKKAGAATAEHTELTKEQEKAAKKAGEEAKRHAEAIEKAGRAMSAAGVADKIAQMNAEIAVANRLGGIAKEQWKKYTEQIDEWVRAGYKVPPLLADFRIAHINLVTSQIKVSDNTKELLAQQRNLWPAIEKTGDEFAGLSVKYQHFANIVQDERGMDRIMKMLSKGIELSPPPPPTLWQTATANMRDAFIGPNGVITDIGAGLADTLAAGLTGAQKFSDGFIGIWQGIKKALTNILADLLNLFINKFLKIALDAITGGQGVWAQALGGLVSGGTKAGVSAGVSAATGAGGTAAGAGAGAAGAGGAGAMTLPGAAAGSGLGALAGPGAGAGVGYAVGRYVGYKTGSKTKGALAGAGAGAATGALVGSVVPGFGTAVGAVVGGVVGAAAGWYGAVKAGKDINKMRDQFAASVGGMEALEKRLAALGRHDLFAPLAFGERNIDSFKQALGNVQEVFEAADLKAAGLKAGFDKLGTAVGAFGSAVPASLRPMLDELLKSKDLTAEMRGTLQGMTTDPSWQTMQSRAQELGIEFSALGSKFNEARVGDIALGYARDLQMFSDAGADMTGVVHGMSDELSELYQDAKKTGVALPDTLAPYMLQLYKMGELVDENGEKVENFDAVAFKEIKDEALLQVVDVLKEIKELLAKGLPKAAEEGAAGIQDALGRNPVRIPIEYEYPDGAGHPQAISTPGEPPELGLWGGTHGQFVDWGPDGTAVTLHGKERVMTEGEFGGGGGPINITVVSKLDGREVARNQIKYIPKKLSLAGV